MNKYLVFIHLSILREKKVYNKKTKKHKFISFFLNYSADFKKY